jgi:hypothetical protein
VVDKTGIWLEESCFRADRAYLGSDKDRGCECVCLGVSRESWKEACLCGEKDFAGAE